MRKGGVLRAIWRARLKFGLLLLALAGEALEAVGGFLGDVLDEVVQFAATLVLDGDVLLVLWHPVDGRESEIRGSYRWDDESYHFTFNNYATLITVNAIYLCNLNRYYMHKYFAI